MRILNINRHRARLSPLVLAALITLFAGAASAIVDDCQPDGLSDAEATRIIAIATVQGKQFRKAIDEMRASGVNYETDKTFEDLMADPERAIALVRERYGFQVYLSYPLELEQTGNIEDVISPRFAEWINRENANYYAIEMYDHLHTLVQAIGGTPKSFPTWFQVDINKFVFALFQFSKGAGLEYVGWSTTRILNTGLLRISYEFSEPNQMSGSDETSKIVVTIMGYKDKNELFVGEVSFDPQASKRDTSHPVQSGSHNCFEAFEHDRLERQETDPMDNGSDAELYGECQRLLDTAPLSELDRYVSENNAAIIRSEKLGKSLLGVKCSGTQIIRYMETHGFRHTGTRNWPEPQDYHFGQYNKVLSFCTPPTNWLERWRVGKCAVGARFVLLDNTIVRIAAAANK